MVEKSRIDNFLGEKPLDLPNRESELIALAYLKKVKKRSNNSYRLQKSVIINFLNHFDKSVKEITKLDVINYFDDVYEPSDLSYDSKIGYRSYLSSFFYHVESIYISQKINFNNPVPNDKVYKFTKNKSDIKKKSEKNAKILSKEQILEILDYCKKNLKKRDFICLGLCVCTGARSSEIRTIKIEDINLEERFFETGFEMGARKSTLGTGESLLFFFPKIFTTYLKNYVITVKNKGQKYLFESPYNKNNNNKNDPIDSSTVERIYLKIRKALGFHFTMHYFRHSMITFLKKGGLSLEDRELLLNHSPSSTQGRHYEHDGIEEIRAIYDKNFPYYDLPYF